MTWVLPRCAKELTEDVVEFFDFTKNEENHVSLKDKFMVKHVQKTE